MYFSKAIVVLMIQSHFTAGENMLLKVPHEEFL